MVEREREGGGEGEGGGEERGEERRGERAGRGRRREWGTGSGVIDQTRGLEEAGSRVSIPELLVLPF